MSWILILTSTNKTASNKKKQQNSSHKKIAAKNLNLRDFFKKRSRNHNKWNSIWRRWRRRRRRQWDTRNENIYAGNKFVSRLKIQMSLFHLPLDSLALKLKCMKISFLMFNFCHHEIWYEVIINVWRTN